MCDAKPTCLSAMESWCTCGRELPSQPAAEWVQGEAGREGINEGGRKYGVKIGMRPSSLLLSSSDTLGWLRLQGYK